MNLYGANGLLSPYYRELFDNIDNYRFFTLKGGRFSAKGDTVYTIMLLDLANEPAEARIYVPIQRNIKTGVFKQVLKVIKRIGLYVKINYSTYSLTLANGSQIYFNGLDAAKYNVNTDLSKGADSDMSNGIRYCIFDELGAFAEFGRIDDIIDTLIRQKECKFFEVSNPPKNKASRLLTRYESQKNDNSVYVLHSTVYNIPKEWVNDGQKNKINEYKKNDIDRYNHAILGLSTGVDGLAYNLSDILIKMPMSGYVSYVIFCDNGVRDATSFLLFGINDDTVHLIDTFYYSGRLNKPKSSYEFGLEMRKFTKYHNLSDDTLIISDDLEFAHQLSNVNGYLNAKSINQVSTKNRSLYYKFTRMLIDTGKFKIVNNENNDIVYKQLSNAQVENKVINGIDRVVVKKVNNAAVSEEEQLHGIDPIHYMSLVFFKKLGGNENEKSVGSF